MRPTLFERVGRAVTIAEPLHDYWYSRTVGIAELGGVARRVSVWRATEPLDDVVRGIVGDLTALREIGGGPISELVEALGPAGAHDGYIHTDDALVTWNELVNHELAVRSAIPEGVTIAFGHALLDGLDRLAAFDGGRSVTFRPPEDLALTADGRLSLSCHVHPNWRSQSHGAAAGLLEKDFGSMAPEVVVGEALSVATLVYALGYVLYRMLAGHPPYTGDTAIGVLIAVRSDPVPDVRDAREGIDPRLVELTHACLAKAPADRPSLDDARAVLQTLGPEAFELEHWVERHCAVAKEARRRFQAALARMDFEASYRTLAYVER